MNSKQTKECMKALGALVAEKGIDKELLIDACNYPFARSSARWLNPLRG